MILGLVLLVTGCDESETPTQADHSKEAGVRSEGQRSATRGQPNEASHQAGSADRNSQGKGPETAARPASNPPGRGPRTIPGMDADTVAAIFLKPGLECFEPVDRDVRTLAAARTTTTCPYFMGTR